MCIASQPCYTTLLQELIRSGSDDVRAAALEAVGNMAFQRPNRAIFLATEGLRELLTRLAQSDPGTMKQCVRIGAIRALAILGTHRVLAARTASIHLRTILRFRTMQLVLGAAQLSSNA